MSITPPASAPTPDPDEVARGLAEIERYTAAHNPVLLAPVPAVVSPEDDDQDDEREDDQEDGETDRVRALRAKVAEAHRLVELQADDAPLLVDTTKVRKRRRRVAEAARLYALSQDPTALAWQDARVRRITTVMSMSAAVIALGVSSIGVQASVVKGLDLNKETDAFGWWAAFGVEPILSLPLLAAVAVQAYAAMRGRPIDRKSPEGKKLFKAEALLLGLTLVLNCWPAIKWGGFDLLPLIVHSLGPLGAVTAIWLLPTLWKILGALPAPDLTGLTYRANAAPLTVPDPRSGKAGKADELAPLVAQARCLIASGELPPYPSANRLRQALKCGMDDARDVRDVLKGDAR
ncbi:hypothetical protein [Planomonospora parontospora]|uniref:hypothetical protein n=1 Tax=Planomonospora parontospora TaxID=58119 RepID=UPI00166FAD4A|nr:hypothetical protein [Planomonospora parontospora]GGL56553.1 hypothetical protein GCM10014719_67480 [Planomonospora parontospora subsp. antibiotica]GII19938.1 hypothetical protein Ppa05_66640 [Planomonospora parontospora subsp. antibiotica]